MNSHSYAMNIASKPLAAEGFQSYRCKTKSGWIMIGAVDDDDALAQAKRSNSDAAPNDIQKWSGVAYLPCIQRTACRAYQATEEDVANVLHSNVLETDVVVSEMLTGALFVRLDFDLIEQAALWGDALDEQTDFANDEIARQLRCLGYLKQLPEIA